MALVLLPCDLPSWCELEQLLWCLRTAVTPSEVVLVLAKIRELCCISLDSDDEEDHAVVFAGLRDFLETFSTRKERRRFFDITLPVIVELALSVKETKPSGGLRFSLQQQRDSVTLDRGFVASLLALAVVCAYPKRTLRSHPTLVDFSFSRFYSSLPRSPSQQAKFRAILQFFDRFAFAQPTGQILFHRKVMPGRQWLPIEAWLHSNQPLAGIKIDPQGSIEDVEGECNRICFGTPRPGEGAFESDLGQESLLSCMHPELLVQCLWTESLEDNECVFAEGIQRISSLRKDAHKAVFDPGIPPNLMGSHNLMITCIDAEDYSDCPIKQYEEDNVLRELNKAFLGFSEDEVKPLQKPEASKLLIRRNSGKAKLPPIIVPKAAQSQIKKSLPVVVAMIPKKSRDSTGSNIKDPWSKDSGIQSEVQNEGRNCDSRTLPLGGGRTGPLTLPVICGEKTSRPTNGHSVSSPVSVDAVGNFQVSTKRRPSLVEASTQKSLYKSCNSELDDFRSANSSIDSDELLNESSVTSRQQFVEQLNKALQMEQYNNSETESSYAVDAVIENPDGNDNEIRLIRGSSRGFVLNEDDDSDSFSGDGLEREKQWLKNFKQKSSSSRGSSQPKDNASRYSFSSDFSSDMEELYEKAAEWLDDSPDKSRVRDNAVARFAKGLLKRTLSDSFSKVAKDIHDIPEQPKQKDLLVTSTSQEEKLPPRSLSLTENLNCRLGIPSESVKVESKVIESFNRRLSPVNVKEEEEVSETLEEAFKVDEHDDFVPPAGIVSSPLSPKVVTPPRMRRGSLILKRAKERSSTRPKQRGRSNSVPVVIEAAQILALNKLAEEAMNTAPKVPHIVISTEEGEEETCTLSRRHKSAELLRNPLLSADVVEGFSFTFAENLIEGILRDHEDTIRASNNNINMINSLHIPTKVKTKRKGILKNSSIDSLDRSPTSSISELSEYEEDAFNNNHKIADRCVSMPSLHEAPLTPQAKPVVTGNWGCGRSQAGDHQLKALIQWLAASRASAPYMVYLTRSHPALDQFQGVIQVISARGWTVGQLTGAILTHCQTKMADALGTSPRLRKTSQYSLFDFLLSMPTTEL